jgi:hypothetical protein
MFCRGNQLFALAAPGKLGKQEIDVGGSTLGTRHEARRREAGDRAGAGYARGDPSDPAAGDPGTSNGCPDALAEHEAQDGERIGACLAPARIEHGARTHAGRRGGVAAPRRPPLRPSPPAGVQDAPARNFGGARRCVHLAEGRPEPRPHHEFPDASARTLGARAGASTSFSLLRPRLSSRSRSERPYAPPRTVLGRARSRTLDRPRLPNPPRRGGDPIVAPSLVDGVQ